MPNAVLFRSRRPPPLPPAKSGGDDVPQKPTFFQSKDVEGVRKIKQAKAGGPKTLRCIVFLPF